MATPKFPLQDQLRGFSRALFSTWLYHKRFNILFDAGEGVATALGNRVFGIRRIFLSHGHADHIAGLVNLLNIRNLGAGDQTASLKIYYPKNNRLLEFLIDYLGRTQRDLSFPLEWIPVEPELEIVLEDQKGRVFARTFETRHSQRQLSVGYNIVEIRRKLKPEFEGLSQKDLNHFIWSQGKAAIAEDTEKIVFSYGGDSRPINAEKIRNSLFLCHECTYINRDDDERNFQQHSFLDEALLTARDAEVKTLLLFHTSLRYNVEALREAVLEAMNRIEVTCRVLLLYEDKIFEVVKNRISGKRFEEKVK